MTTFKTRIFILICLGGLFHSIQAKAQTSNDSSTSAKAKEVLLDTIIDIFKTRSIYKDKVNWDVLKPQLYKSIDYSTSNTARAIIPAYIKLSDILKITHGGLIYEGKGYGAEEGFREMQNRISDNIREAAKKMEYSFRTAIIAKQYGYISIPSVDIEFSEDMEKVKQEMTKKASAIQDSLCKLNMPGLKGIILDLRLNGGGSTVTMIGGLTSLYDETTIFNFVMADGSRHKITKGKKYLTFYNDTLVKLEPKCPVSNELKLAVLISPYTASAGEQTAISFEGRKNTIFIGEKTKGMPTGVSSMPIRKDLILDYAGGYAADRNGKGYENDVSPDKTVVGGDDFKNLENDKKVQEAIKWFAEKK